MSMPARVLFFVIGMAVVFGAFVLMSGLLVGGLWEIFEPSTRDPKHGRTNSIRLVWASIGIVFAVFAAFMASAAGIW